MFADLSDIKSAPSRGRAACLLLKSLANKVRAGGRAAPGRQRRRFLANRNKPSYNAKCLPVRNASRTVSEGVTDGHLDSPCSSRSGVALPYPGGRDGEVRRL